MWRRALRGLKASIPVVNAAVKGWRFRDAEFQLVSERERERARERERERERASPGGIYVCEYATCVYVYIYPLC